MFKILLISNKFNKFVPNARVLRLLSSISQVLETKKAGDEVTVKGWIKSIRNQKDLVFLDVNDGSTPKRIQVCLAKDLKYEGLNAGASVVASGALTVSPKGQIELSASNIQVQGACVVSDGYPFAPRKIYPPEYLRQYLHLRPRTSVFAALLRVRSVAELAIHNYFNSEGFTNINTPILTSNDCEGAGEVFCVLPDSKKIIKSMFKEGQSDDEVYFNNKTFLTVSGQLHLEAAAHGLSKVYTLGPTFRAENSRSRLHLSEFYMLEAEIAFMDKLTDLTSFVEKLLKCVTRMLLNEAAEDVEKCQDSKQNFTWLDKDFPTLTYSEVIKILENNGGKFKENFSPSDGLGKEHELFLVQHCGNVPVFVTNWPKEMKPFYMRETKDGTVAAFDLLGPIVGEIVGGSFRENDYSNLKLKMPRDANLDWYLELRKFGSVPTGGFGLGLERYLQSILGIYNIKDVIPFPRWPHNCTM